MSEPETPDELRQMKNTDRELWREREGDYYADSIHVTEGGGIGINCGGYVMVRPLRAWFDAMQRAEAAEAALAASRAESAEKSRLIHQHQQAYRYVLDTLKNYRLGAQAYEKCIGRLKRKNARLRAALSGDASPTAPDAPAGRDAPVCECFGDSGLHASTFRNEAGAECCDLCGRPVAAGSKDALRALSQHGEGR